MNEQELRKLLVIRQTLVVLEVYLQRRATGTHGAADIETMIMYYGRQDNITADEAWNAIEESLIDAFHL